MENIADVDWGIVARIVHVLAVVVWIGAVWFVTAVPHNTMNRLIIRMIVDRTQTAGGALCPQS
jgi:hypothetical protein